MLYSRSDAIQSSSLGESLTTSVEACSESTSTQERSTGLPHDKVPRKQNNWAEDSVSVSSRYT